VPSKEIGVPAVTVVSSASTAAVEIEDRLAYWEDYNADALVGLTCITYQPDGLLSRQLNLDLHDFRVAEITGNPHAVERPPGNVRSQPKDATFVSMVIGGDSFFYHSGGCMTLRPGDTVVYDTDRPYLFGFGRAPGRQHLFPCDGPHRQPRLARPPQDEQHLEDEMADAALLLQGSPQDVLQPVGRPLQPPEGQDQLVVGGILRRRDLRQLVHGPPLPTPPVPAPIMPRIRFTGRTRMGFPSEANGS
jgi:hypothetical protein